ncbi:MAG: tetratricopeptide repeat protein, partial [bacterium]
ASDPEIDKKVALLVMPDLLSGAGMTVVPNRMVFLGFKEGNVPDPSKLLEAHRSFWQEMVPKAKMVDGKEIAARSGMLAANTLRQMSMVANNLGVLMEDLGRPADAFEAYSKAHEIEPGNISALLNMESMLAKGSAAGDVAGVRKNLETIAKRQKTKPGIWALSHFFGYVRSPATFAELAAIWARMGLSATAVSDLTRALKLLPSGRKREGLGNLAALYLSVDMPDKAEATYKKLLAEDPKDGLALLGLARIARMNLDLEAAAEFLKKAEVAGIDGVQIALEQANTHIAAGDYDKARVVLEKLVETRPEMLDAWQLLGEVLVHDNDRAALDMCLKRMSKIDGGQQATAYLSARMALRQDDSSTARRLLEQALVSRPDNPRLLEQLLRLDFAEAGKDRLYAHAKALLRIAPTHALANYAMGSFQDQQGNTVLAEDLYRRSMEKERLPQALNDLAWLLQKRGEFQEAEKLIREVVGVNRKMPRVWDTLGIILTRSGNLSTNRFAEAEQAFETALSLAPNGPMISLHMADLQAKMGKIDRARELVSKVLPKRERLRPEEQKDLDSLVDRLGVKK